MSSKRKYWKTQEELNSTDLFNDLSKREFVEEIPVDEFLGNEEKLSKSEISRRDFLKYLGFSTAVVGMASCRGPVNKIIPYVVKSDKINPGQAEYFATTLDNGEDFASILVKTREGRPIKIEPNREASFFNTTNARVQASILSLYDNNRLKKPKYKGEEKAWEEIDSKLKEELKNISSKNKEIVILSHSINSPSTLGVIEKFKLGYNNVSLVQYDAFSNSSILDAYQEIRGVRALPKYSFKKAKYIISFGADFLGNWMNGTYKKEYSEGRNPSEGEMSKHFQFESVMSLSGANADERIPIKPSQHKKILLKLMSLIADKKEFSKGDTDIDQKLHSIAQEVKKNLKNTVIITDIDDKNIQKLVLEFNEKFLNSDVLELDYPIYLNKGNNRDLETLISNMKGGKVGAIMLNNVNPAYNLYNSEDFLQGLDKVELKIQFTEKEDETSKNIDYLLPLNNYLENWGDSNPMLGHYTLSQPIIQKIFDTRQLEETLLKLSEDNVSYYNFIREYWKNNITPDWNKALHDGFFVKKESVELSDNFEGFSSLLDKINLPKESDTIELVLYLKESLGVGNCANNPWLQEMADPITRVTWDNYVTINKRHAKELGLRNWHLSNGALVGDKVNMILDDLRLENIPVLIQPGQKYGTVGLALGYGRDAESIKKDMHVGVNAYKLYKNSESNQFGLRLEKIEGSYHKFACIQLHNTMMGRDIIRETTLDVYKTQPKEGWNPDVTLETHKGKQRVSKIDLWEGVDRTTGHHFNMSIDLNLCIGCGACTISCQSENNIPVVGKDEVAMSRDMHWIRIDRYYSSDMTKDNQELGAIDKFSKMEEPSENPEVLFQPVMCQHCNHAPCETVCPVAATSHGKEGQNQMAYNRCVGTRYCANNCPYKVRRFNWFKYYNNDKFDYVMNDELYRMSINPDVVVRERGVMEKCSMCIQRTQAGKLTAKKEGRKLQDNDIQVACASSCPTDAIKFGDINDENSKIQLAYNDDRKYYLLEAVGTKPNIFYQTKIRNKK